MLVTAVGMYLFVLVGRWLPGAESAEPFSWRAFALTWLLGAVIAWPLEWWLDRRPNAGPSRWQPAVPRSLRTAGRATELVWTATAFAAAMTGVSGEMSPLWAAAAAVLAFVPMAVLQDRADRHGQAASAPPPG
ncbi:hypothetical protein GCM10009661_16930 [Catellatospora chokoriensis]